MKLEQADDFLLTGVRKGYQVGVSSKARSITRVRVWLKSEAGRGFSIGSVGLGRGRTSILPKEAALLQPLWQEALALETLANSEEVYGLFDCADTGVLSGVYVRDIPKRPEVPKDLITLVDQTIGAASSLETALGCLAKHVETLFHSSDRDHQRRLLLQRLLIKTLPQSEAVGRFVRTNLVVNEPLLQLEAAIFVGSEAIDTICQLALRKDVDSKSRLAALKHLENHLPGQSFAPILMSILGERAGEEHFLFAVNALGSMKYEPARIKIEWLVGHRNARLADAVLTALAEFGSAKSQFAILVKLEGLPAAQCRKALSVLGQIGDVECIASLRSLSFRDRETKGAVKDTIAAIMTRLQIDGDGGHLALSEDAGGDGGLTLAADDGGGLALEKRPHKSRKKGPDEA